MLKFWDKLDRNDKIVLLLGFFTAIKIRIIGVFSGAEILLLLMLLFQRNNQYKENKYVLKLVFFAVLWIIGTIISNIYNHVNQLDFIKGVLFLVVLVLIIPPIYELIYEKPERLVLFYLSYGFGGLLSRFTTNDTNLTKALSADVYVYYSIAAAIAGVSYLIYLRGSHKLGVLLRYSISVIGLFNMARSPFLVSTIAFVLLYVISKIQSNDVTAAVIQYRKKVPVLFFAVFVSAFAVDSIYEKLAANGILGVDAQEKYYKQMMFSGNILEGGRTETFMGIQLIKENPIWGYGSYARDINDTFHMRYAQEHNREYRGNIHERYLPAHSHIVCAWMQNGILGGLFWLYVLLMCWKVFSSGCFMNEPRLLCLLMFQLCSLLWSICFSPFGDRVLTMFFIITLFIIYDSTQKGTYRNGSIKRLYIK